MTDKEYKENKIIGYGIAPCGLLAILTDCVIANCINSKHEMAFGLFIFGILLFAAYCTLWMFIVKNILSLFSEMEKQKYCKPYLGRFWLYRKLIGGVWRKYGYTLPIPTEGNEIPDGIGHKKILIMPAVGS